MTVSVSDSFDTGSWKRIVTLFSQSGRGDIRYTLRVDAHSDIANHRDRLTSPQVASSRQRVPQ
jgi:hypothetical protein